MLAFSTATCFTTIYLRLIPKFIRGWNGGKTIAQSSSDISHVRDRAILASSLTGICRPTHPPYLVI